MFDTWVKDQCQSIPATYTPEAPDPGPFLCFDHITISERQAVTLNVLQNNDILIPGDTVVFEAVLPPDINYARDTLLVHYAHNNNRLSVFLLEKGEDGIYRGELQIRNNHIGSLRIAAVISDINTENDSITMNTSNIISLRIAPDMSKVYAIEFMDNPFITIEGMESRVEILFYNHAGNVIYVFSNLEDLVFSVEDESIGEITDGVLKAKTVGETTITASFHSLEATAVLRVFPDRSDPMPYVPVTDVTLTPASANLTADSTLQLTASVTPAYATNRGVI